MTSRIIITKKFSELSKMGQNFVLSTWKRSLRKDNDYYRLIDADAYDEAYDIYLAGLVRKPNAEFRLSVFDDDQDLIEAWSLVEGDTLHYVYVRPELRRKGIGLLLVPLGIQWFSQITKTGMLIWSYPPWRHMRFDPFHVR